MSSGLQMHSFPWTQYFYCAEFTKHDGTVVNIPLGVLNIGIRQPKQRWSDVRRSLVSKKRSPVGLQGFEKKERP